MTVEKQYSVVAAGQVRGLMHDDLVQFLRVQALQKTGRD